MATTRPDPAHAAPPALTTTRDPREVAAADPMALDLASDALPLVPAALLAAHACLIPGDTRYRSALRLRQALWRESLGLAPGLHRPGGASTLPPTPLGSMLTPSDAARGANFATAEIHAATRRSLAFCEEGAQINADRILRNMLSSEPLVRNCLMPLALDRDLATRVFARLLPGFVHRVEAVRFETAPTRDRADPRALQDGTAFDAALLVVTPDGEAATLFVEVKLTEAFSSAPARHRARYDAASREVALHHDPDDRALRSVALEQLWRLHMLAELCVRQRLTPRAHLLVLHPGQNRHVAAATRRYAGTLKTPEDGRTGFSTLTLERFVAALHEAGATREADYLDARYLDLGPVIACVLRHVDAPCPPTPPAAPVAPALPPPTEAATADGTNACPRPASPLRRRPSASPTPGTTQDTSRQPRGAASRARPSRPRASMPRSKSAIATRGAQ